MSRILWDSKQKLTFKKIPEPVLVYNKSSVADPDSDPSDPYVLGLLDPDPDTLVRGLDPDPAPDPSIIKLK